VKNASNRFGLISRIIRGFLPNRPQEKKRKRRLLIEGLENRQLFAGLPPLLDINTTSDSVGSNPNSIVEIGSNAFFFASTSTSSTGLWKSNGAAGGTFLIKDLSAGGGIASARNLTNVNGTLYFSANDGISGEELWKSDGTSSGTVLIRDIKPESGSSSPRFLTNVNGTLFFSANDGVNGVELWKSDGTANGTVLVKDVLPGSSGANPSSLLNMNGILYFNATDGTNGLELWKSDGNAAGTVMVKDISSGSSSSDPRSFANVNGTLYFRATDSLRGTELWKSDGTSVGTVLVKDISVGASSSTPDFLTNANGTLYFNATDSVNGMELWKSDGSLAGTVLVKDIFAGSGSSSPSSLTYANGKLFFTASDSANGTELWKSDGTSVGTVLVRDISVGSNSASPRYLTNANGTLYFSADDNVTGSELWKSDGTAAGTMLVKDMLVGNGSSSPRFLTNVNGILFFSATDGVRGNELWKADGTASGTVLVKDIVGTAGSSPRGLTNVNGTLYFSALDGTHGRELWKSDGSVSGTSLVKDIIPGSTGSYPDSLMNLNGKLYFRLSGSNTWWNSDGTSNGTAPLTGALKDARNLTDVNGTLYFTTTSNANGTEIWKSDATSANIVLVKDIALGNASSNPNSLTNVNGTLYFTANDGSNGVELWKSNGTATGTVMVKNISAGSGSANPSSLTNVNGALFFMADDGLNGAELWKSDGTTAGTVMVKDISVGSSSSNPSSLVNMNGTLYFRANDGMNGTELWRSNGTNSGTTLVKDLWVGVNGSNPSFLTNVNGTLYFQANDAVNGVELWKSDGTAAGTLLNDITVDSASSFPSEFTVVNDLLLFSSTSDEFGAELQVLKTNSAPSVPTQTFLINDRPLAESLVGVVDATDTRPGQTLSYSIVGNNSNNTFSIESTTGAIRIVNTRFLPTIPPGQNSASVALQVKVSQNASPFAASTATVNVVLSNALPIVSMAPTVNSAVFTVAENNSRVDGSTVVGTLKPLAAFSGQRFVFLSLTGIDAANFRIDDSGVITLAPAVSLNFEAKQSYSFLARVADSLDPSKISSAIIKVLVKNLNDEPVYTLLDGEGRKVPIIGDSATLTIAENTPGNTTKNGLVIGTLKVTDDDQPANTLRYQQNQSGQSIVYDPARLFAYDSASGQISIVDASKLSFEKSKQFFLSFLVTDSPLLTDPNSKASTTKLRLTVTLQDMNEAPIISSASQVEVNEDNLANARIIEVRAADQDKRNSTQRPVIYSIQSQKDSSGRNVTLFSMDYRTGIITVPTAGALDYETNKKFTLVVRAADSGNQSLFTEQTLTVNLADINEAADFVLKDRTGAVVPLINNALTLNAVRSTAINNSTIIGNLKYTDPDVGNAGQYAVGSIANAVREASAGALSYNETTGDLIILDKTKLKTGRISFSITDKSTPKPVTSKFSFNLNVN
jgi:ELWxxDGT repeat protein